MDAPANGVTRHSVAGRRRKNRAQETASTRRVEELCVVNESCDNFDDTARPRWHTARQPPAWRPKKRTANIGHLSKPLRCAWCLSVSAVPRLVVISRQRRQQRTRICSPTGGKRGNDQNVGRATTREGGNSRRQSRLTPSSARFGGASAIILEVLEIPAVILAILHH